MTTIFQDVIANGQLLISLDDILLLGDKIDMQAHYKLINEVLRRLQQHGLRLRSHKCKFAVEQVILLGEGFLRLARYLRKYVNNYAEILLPLQEAGQKFTWLYHNSKPLSTSSEHGQHHRLWPHRTTAYLRDPHRRQRLKPGRRMPSSRW